MAPPKQSNTIDFDAAKQKRGAQPGAGGVPRAGNLMELRQQLTQQLQSSPRQNASSACSSRRSAS